MCGLQIMALKPSKHPSSAFTMLLSWLAALLVCAQATADTLESVRARGLLRCGVNEALPGFSISDANGKWSGIDVDLCRAVAAATIGKADAVTFIPLTARDRFPALQAGEVDVLVRNTTWTLLRDSQLEIDFAGVNYYDGQAFMTRASTGFKSIRDLDNTKICVSGNTTTELNLADYFRTNGMAYEPVVFVRFQEIFAAYDAGLCDALTADQSSLSANRPKLEKPEDHVILPEVISKEPLGPAVKHGDDGWTDIVRWSLYAMIAAEEYGITSKNVERERTTTERAEVRRLLGVEENLGEMLGLSGDWAYQIVLQVGNYGESFERNLGSGSAIKIARGMNALWRDGGLMYAMPFR
jgi:general L-amino acid transport system substrate-binding protein